MFIRTQSQYSCVYLAFLSRDQSDDDDVDDHVWSKHVANLWIEYVVVL
jgi:hypothetical protein